MASTNLADGWWGGPERGGQEIIHDVANPRPTQRLRNASSKMRLQYLVPRHGYGSLNRRKLIQDLYAVSMLIHHANHPVEMTGY